MKYLYLHGFASSPNSYKAQFMRRKFTDIGLNLDIPDLNLTDFSTVTLSDQLEYLQQNYLQSLEPVTVIGSSLGGFLGVQLAAQNTLVQKLILFAPAFGFSQRIAKVLGNDNVAKWQQEDVREFYHYGLKRNVNLHFNFFADAQKYSEAKLTRSLPTLIFHGIHDDVVPAFLSEDFAQRRSQVTLKLLDDDHALGKDLETIWQDIQLFCDF
jgi:uncharacterized protein